MPDFYFFVPSAGCLRLIGGYLKNGSCGVWCLVPGAISLSTEYPPSNPPSDQPHALSGRVPRVHIFQEGWEVREGNGLRVVP